jgi:hypothetical protein
MDPGTAGILVAEGAALAAVLAAYSLGREPSAATAPEASAAPAPAAPGSAAASVTVPDSTEDPTIEALPDVSAAKKALQTKQRELEKIKITREATLLTKLDEGKPPVGAPGDQWKAWKAARPIKEQELRLEFKNEDEDNALVLKGLQKALDDERAKAVNAKATAAEAAAATATTIPEQPNGALPAETLAFNADAAAAAAPGEGKPGVGGPPRLPLPTDLEKKDFTTAVELAMANKFKNLQPAIDLADKTPSLLAGTYGEEKDPFLVYFMKKLIHAAVQNKLRWRINVRTDRVEAKKYAAEEAVASTGRGRVRTPRRIRGGASTVEANTMILKTLNVLKDRGETDPKELTPIMTAFLLLVAEYNEENLGIYNNLVDIFTTFIDYKGYADRWRTYLTGMGSPDRKLVANVMFATALEVTNVDALNPYFFWARSGLRNSWGDAVAAKSFTIDPAKLTERKKVTAQGPENAKSETLNAAAGEVLTKIRNAQAEAAKAAADTAPMKAAKAALKAAVPAPGAGEVENANAGAVAAAQAQAAAALAAAEQRATVAETMAQEAAAALAAAVAAEKQRAGEAAAAAATAAAAAYEHSSLRSESSNSVDPRGAMPVGSDASSLASVPFHVAGRGFGDAVSLVKDAVAAVARIRKIAAPVPRPVQTSGLKRQTNSGQMAANKRDNYTLLALRIKQNAARSERAARFANMNAARVASHPAPDLQAALDSANEVAAQAVQSRRTSGIGSRIEELNEELAFYLAWLTQQEAETGFVPTKQMANPPRRGGSRRKTSRRRHKKARTSTFRRNRKH